MHVNIIQKLHLVPCAVCIVVGYLDEVRCRWLICILRYKSNIFVEEFQDPKWPQLVLDFPGYCLGNFQCVAYIDTYQRVLSL